MRELSIFIDESGDFGKYAVHSPYYIITMVFHEQGKSIEDEVSKLEQELRYLGVSSHCIHTGPIIRKEENYRFMDVRERRRIFNKMVAFIRQADIRYKHFYIEKKHMRDAEEAAGKLEKQIAVFLKDHYEVFLGFELVKIYYDNGQGEVSKILSSVFDSMIPGIEFRKVMPFQYKLFQAADLLCTLELIRLKSDDQGLSKSERLFFGNTRDLKKNYIKPLQRKEWR